MKWNDEGTGFIINNRRKLAEVLPRYFRTSRVISFIRQLYIYNFRTIKVDKVKEYHNDDFIRGKYSELVKVKKGSITSREADEIEEDARAEYIKLSRNYDELWMSVLDLKERTNELIVANHAMVMQELHNRFDFIDRLKSTMVSFVLQVMYYDDQTNEAVKQHVGEKAESKELASEQTFKSFRDSIELPEQAKAEIHKAFFEFNDRHSNIAKVLHIIIESFNRRFFKMESDKFYDIVLRFFVRDEDPLHLYRIHNYNMLKRIKEVFDEFCGLVIADYLPARLQLLYQSMQRLKDVEVLTCKVRAQAQEKTISDCFSVRTLRDLPGFVDLDLFAYFGVEFD